MRNLLFAVAACFVAAKPIYVEAESRHTNVNAVSGWEAVGRLTMNDRAMCTGALIAPNLVLTAAHCLYDPYTGRKVNPKTIRFDAGLSNGSAKATRMVAAAYGHPDYKHKRRGRTHVGVDLAVLKLQSPISSSQIRPFETEARPDRGDSLGVISYTHVQTETPQLQHPCQVLARQGETLVMNCEVEFGASGAPVFAVQGGSQPRLVSVISAKAAMGNRPVSVGTILDRALQVLLHRAG